MKSKPAAGHPASRDRSQTDFGNVKLTVWKRTSDIVIPSRRKCSRTRFMLNCLSQCFLNISRLCAIFVDFFIYMYIIVKIFFFKSLTFRANFLLKCSINVQRQAGTLGVQLQNYLKVSTPAWSSTRSQSTSDPEVLLCLFPLPKRSSVNDHILPPKYCFARIWTFKSLILP